MSTSPGAFESPLRFSAVIADFFADAKILRGQFEERVGPARDGDPKRFVWDYWHVPGQYTYLRTLASSVFEPATLGRLVAALRAWGVEHLGCGNITHPWLSYYVEGCQQELHTDVQQGPFAFVYSLTRWDSGAFLGGETVLLRPRTLNYWEHFDPTRSTERDELLIRVPPRYNQLLVFDGRVPHGVLPVRGTSDPLSSRVAVHGWYLPPRAAVAGGLTMADVRASIAFAHETWAGALRPDHDLIGTLVVRAEIDPTGAVLACAPVVSTLISTSGRVPAEPAVADAVRLVGSLRLPARGRPSALTIPFGLPTSAN